jgi:bifunctional DNA-binding transcriptional regulator/antitoxin component of YhaV-PrlF toxin-antitoxin module
MGATRGKHTATLSTKGQVILPKAICGQRRWATGTRPTVEDTPDGVLLKPAPVFAPTSIDVVFGSLRHEGPARSIEDMDAAIMAEAKRRARD